MTLKPLSHAMVNQDTLTSEFCETLNLNNIFGDLTQCDGDVLSILLQFPQADANGLIDMELHESNRSTSTVAKDHEEIVRTLPANVIPWEKARIQYDPDNLFATFTATATTPSPLANMKAVFSDGSTHAYELNGDISGSQVASGTNYAESISDTDVLRIFLGSNTALTQFYGYNNNLTGSIPDLSSNTALTHFRYFNNNLTGSIPDLSSNTALVQFQCFSNNLTGSIPDLSSNTALVQFQCFSNNLTGYTASTISSTVTTFNAASNALVESAINQILIDCDTASLGTGDTITLDGGTNAAPTGAGATAKANLIARGASVTTN